MPGWVAPVAAAAVVAAVLVALASPMRGMGGHQPLLGAAPAATPPRFYLTAAARNPLAVYDSTTGRRIAQTSIGPFAKVTATGDGKTFFAASANANLYRIRVNADGRIDAIAPLPVRITPDGFVESLAASRDGTRLAIAFYPNSENPTTMHSDVRVIDLRTNTVTTWRATRPGTATSVSMDASGHTLAFVWASMENKYVAQVRALDPTSRSGDLLKSRVVVNGSSESLIQDPVALTADGHRIAVCRKTNMGQVRIVEYSVTTGRSIYVLVVGKGGIGDFSALAFDSTSTNLLFYGGGYPMSRLTNGEISQLGEPEDAGTGSIDNVVW